MVLSSRPTAREVLSCLPAPETQESGSETEMVRMRCRRPFFEARRSQRRAGRRTVNAWSGDGRWIYFDSARAGEQQAFKIPAKRRRGHPGNARWWLCAARIAGRQVFYMKALADGSLWRVPVEGGQATKLLEGVSSYQNLAIVNSGAYFVPVRNGAASLFHSVSGLRDQSDQPCRQTLKSLFTWVTKVVWLSLRMAAGH